MENIRYAIVTEATAKVSQSVTSILLCTVLHSTAHASSKGVSGIYAAIQTNETGLPTINFVLFDLHAIAQALLLIFHQLRRKCANCVVDMMLKNAKNSKLRHTAQRTR